MKKIIFITSIFLISFIGIAGSEKKERKLVREMTKIELLNRGDHWLTQADKMKNWTNVDKASLLAMTFYKRAELKESIEPEENNGGIWQ